MADNVNITPGSGDVIAADQVTDGTLGSVKVQFVKIMSGTLDGTNKAAVTSNGLSVDVAASVLPTGAASALKQSDGTQKTQVVDGSGNVIASTANALNVNISSGNISAGVAGTPSSNVVSVQGITSMVPVNVTLTGTNDIRNVSGSVSLPTGASTAAKQPALGTAGTASTDVISVQGIASMTPILAAGNVAAAASDSGNPVKIGGVGHTALPSTVSDGQRVNASFDNVGRQLSVCNLRTNTGTQVTSISDTSEHTIVTAISSFYADLYGLVLANVGATATTVIIKNGTGGTTAMEFFVPAGDTRGFMLPLDAGLANASTNAAWTATCGSSTTMVVSALYVKNV